MIYDIFIWIHFNSKVLFLVCWAQCWKLILCC